MPQHISHINLLYYNMKRIKRCKREGIMGRFALLGFLFLTAANLFSLGGKEAVPEPVPQPSQQYLNANDIVSGAERAEQVVRALLAAYPRQIDRVEFRNGDWALMLRGTWFYYAEGRMLPENLLAGASQFSPQPFYNYRGGDLPPWRDPTAEETARYRAMVNNRSSNPPRRSSVFFDSLWQAGSRDEAYRRVKSIRFLGKPVMVHYLILENLALVEDQILTAAKTDSGVQAWINSLHTVEGWIWRDIADIQSRSFHAYGLAIDLLPRSLGSRETYWLWAQRKRTDWWNVSYNNRYHPPAAVIQAFEKYGFIWGGKWLFFDTMHFEYRPEILILGGISPETRR
jgi:hypothetical protein